VLFGEFGDTGFPDDVDFDLSRIIQLSSIFLTNFPSFEDHLVVLDIFRTDQDSDFAPSLDGEGFLNAGKGVGNFFKLLDPFDVVLQILAPAPGRAAEIASAAATRTEIIESGSTSP